jgi:hypothetical protein
MYAALHGSQRKARDEEDEMKGITRITILVALVFVLTAAMATTALAKPQEKAAKPPIIFQAPADAIFVYPSTAGWSTAGTWAIERYSTLLPPYTAGPDLLVANRATSTSPEVTASYAFAAKYKNYEVYASTYWSCGNAEIYADGNLVWSGSLTGTAPYGSATPDVLLASGKFPGNPHDPHTLMIRALGTGGPTSVTIGGITYPVSGLNFVNIQYFAVW